MLLFATASVNEGNVTAEKVDVLPIDPNPAEVRVSESMTVVLRSLEIAIEAPRVIGAWNSAAENDVYRLWSADTPVGIVSVERTIALPDSYQGVVLNDMYFVNVQFQNGWTWSIMDTGGSRNMISSKFIA